MASNENIALRGSNCELEIDDSYNRSWVKLKKTIKRLISFTMFKFIIDILQRCSDSFTDIAQFFVLLL